MIVKNHLIISNVIRLNSLPTKSFTLFSILLLRFDISILALLQPPNMKKFFLLFGFQILVLLLAAQPYVDPFQVRYTYAFRSGGNSRGTPFTHLWAGSDLPIKIKNNTYLLLSPFYENWQIDSGSVKNIQPTVHSLALPIGLIVPLKNKKWTMVINPILRTNGEELFAKNTFQLGGVGFFGYERSPGQKIRFGAYMNSDFFRFLFYALTGCRLENG
jgi:hypothetical protein